MSYSLQSRDLIADSIETVMGAQWYDAAITIPGCDKNMPGCLIAMGRLNRPVADGLRRHDPRRLHGETRSSTSSPPSRATANISPARSTKRAPATSSGTPVPGAGACGGMYTANTMASAIEALGMSLPYSSSTPAEDPLKLEECVRAGAAIRNLLELDLKPRDIMTRAAFENAMVVVTVLGGSTNAVLHLIAMARSVDVPLDDRRFPGASAIATPLLADFKPSGKYVMEDLQAVGGMPAVMKMLLEEGMIDGDCMTVTGKTIAENVKDLPGLTPGPADRPAARHRRSKPPATSRSCTAISPRRARWPRSPARKGCGSPARPRFTTPKKTCCTPSNERRSAKATWS